MSKIKSAKMTVKFGGGTTIKRYADGRWMFENGFCVDDADIRTLAKHGMAKIEEEQPAPASPKWVAVEIDWDQGGRFQHPSLGVHGYVYEAVGQTVNIIHGGFQFAEKPELMWHSPIAWLGNDGDLYRAIHVDKLEIMTRVRATHVWLREEDAK